MWGCYQSKISWRFSLNVASRCWCWTQWGGVWMLWSLFFWQGRMRCALSESAVSQRRVLCTYGCDPNEYLACKGKNTSLNNYLLWSEHAWGTLACWIAGSVSELVMPQLSALEAKELAEYLQYFPQKQTFLFLHWSTVPSFCQMFERAQMSYMFFFSFGTWFCTGAYYLRSLWCESGSGCAVSRPADSSGCVLWCLCIRVCSVHMHCWLCHTSRYAAIRESSWNTGTRQSQGQVQHGHAQQKKHPLLLSPKSNLVETFMLYEVCHLLC